jgi:hypothetical protein
MTKLVVLVFGIRCYLFVFLLAGLIPEVCMGVWITQLFIFWLL